MSDLIYAPPEAAVEVQAAEEAEFYVVSPKKFFLLSFMTLNLYIVYWFYRNWKVIKLRTGESMWPPMRGLFYIFFTHSLFTDVDEMLKDKHKQFDWRPMPIATASAPSASDFAMSAPLRMPPDATRLTSPYSPISLRASRAMTMAGTVGMPL